MPWIGGQWDVEEQYAGVAWAVLSKTLTKQDRVGHRQLTFV